MCCGQLDWHLHQAPPLRRTGSWTKDRPGQIDNSPLLEDWPWHNFWGQTGCLARFIPCFFLPLFLPFSHLQLLTSASWFHVLRIFCRKGGGGKNGRYRYMIYWCFFYSCLLMVFGFHGLDGFAGKFIDRHQENLGPAQWLPDYLGGRTVAVWSQGCIKFYTTRF